MIPHWRRCWIPVFIAATIVPLLSGFLPQVLWAQPYLSQTGRWSADNTWPATAVHMALVPGSSPYHSQILWWQAGHEDTLFGGLWGWTPTSDDCSAWPGNSFVNLPILPPTKNIFCAGQTHLADGKVLIAGGTEIGTENGMTHLVTFDPLQRSWTQQPDMYERRWYPTATTLPSGEALITSGSRFGHINVFGGVANGASLPADNRIHRYGHVEDGEWDSPVEKPVNFAWPSARLGHSAIPYRFHSTSLYFGGVDTAGAYVNDIWRQDRTARSAFHADYEYKWGPLNIVEGGPPLPRSEHVAIELKDGRMIVFGGRGLDIFDQETVHSGVWALTPVTSPSTGYSWVPIQISIPNGSPGPLHGHAIVYEPLYDRMYLFGGATTLGGTLASNQVWALHFDQQDTTVATWEQVTVEGASLPAARFNHTMGFDSGIASHLMRRSAVLFGGEGAGGALQRRVEVVDQGRAHGRVDPVHLER